MLCQLLRMLIRHDPLELLHVAMTTAYIQNTKTYFHASVFHDSVVQACIL